MKKYTEYIVHFEPFLPEIVSGILWELNITGITENEDSISVWSDSESNISISQVERLLRNLEVEGLINEFSVTQKQLEERNWNEEWEKNINVIKAGSRIVIKPSFRDYKPEQEQIVIIIDPKMSFGTGEHPTTKLMIQLLEEFVSEGMKVLDVGSGTAVLAITAVKLGASAALAIDNDMWCFENGSENCRLNQVNDKIDVRLNCIEEISEKDFDLIAANIQKDVLLNISDEIKKKLKNNGIAILSGLLKDDEYEIIQEYSSKGFFLAGRKELGEWIAMVFRN